MDYEQRGLPNTVYGQAYELAIAAGLNPDALRLNGGDIAHSFPPYFQSLYGMESSVVESYRHLQRDYPRIKFLLGNATASPPIVADGVSKLITAAAMSNADFINELERARIKNQPLELIEYGLSRSDVTVSMRLVEMLQTNLSQHHRRIQKGSLPDMLLLVTQCAQALNRWCGMTDWKWSLRPPIAMIGNNERSLSSLSHFRGLTDDKLRMGISNLQAAEYIEKEFPTLHRSIFAVHPGQPGLYWSEYHWWNDSMLSGSLVNDKLKIHIGLTPAGILPQFLHPTRSEIPFIIQPLIPSSLASDQLVVYTGINEDNIFDSQDLAYKVLHSMSDEYKIAARVMAMCAAALTIIVSTMDSGRGIRKPQWMQSPPNAWLILHLRLTSQYLLSQLDRYTAARGLV